MSFVQLTPEQWEDWSTDPLIVKNPPTAVCMKKQKLKDDSLKVRKLKQFGENQDSDPSSFESMYCDLMEKEMATHSSIFAWKIPWTEEPGRLQSIVLQRVGHN